MTNQLNRQAMPYAEFQHFQKASNTTDFNKNIKDDPIQINLSIL